MSYKSFRKSQGLSAQSHFQRRGRREGYPRFMQRVFPSLLRQVNSISQTYNPEYKSIDVHVNDTRIATSGISYYLNPISQGVDTTSRIGDAILAKSLFIRYSLTSGGSVSALTRVTVVVNLDGFPAYPAWHVGGDYDVMQRDDVLAPMSEEHSGNWAILYDKMHNTTFDTVNVKTFEKFFLKLNYPINYDGAGNTIAASSNRATFLMCYSDAAAVNPLLSFESRLRYVDN